MNLGNIGWSGLLLVVIILLIFWGPSKLPDIGRAFGRSLKEFKDATRGIMEDSEGAENAKKQPPSGVHSETTQFIEPIPLKEHVEQQQP